MRTVKLLDADFSRGVVAISEVYEAEVERLRVATLRMHAYLDSGARDGSKHDQLADDLRADFPIWWRISGVHFWLGEHGLAERRAGLARLIGAVEQMYRAELGLRATAAPDGSLLPERNPDSPCFYDPLREICHFLQLPLSKLSQLCLEMTGLRMHELGDVVRAEGIRGTMTGTYRPLLKQWWESLSTKESAKLSTDVRDVAWVFLKWVRGRGRAGNRKKWAWSRGIPNAARLGKAVYQETGLTLEELDVEIAAELVGELMGVATEKVEMVCAQGAGLSDVGDVRGEEEAAERVREVAA